MPVSILEVENFKSYGGKHIIGPFSHHFTSIIGPNGCGKSNLMDAISFVFGINAASLRSSQLRDLIYRNSNDVVPRKLKCIVTLVYKHTNEDDDDDDESEEIRFTRSILPSGVGEYSVNGIVKSRKEYEVALEQIGVYVQARNFLVFQGDVENLARKNPMEMTTLFETISGSIDYKEEYDTAFQHKEDMEQQQKTIVQQKKVHEYERQQYKIQKLEADTFHKLLQQRNTTLTEYYLWQLYHIYQDKLEKEASAAMIANDVQAASEEEQQIVQELRNVKKEAALARRTTATCEKQRVTQAALCDQYEPTHIQITEEITNLKNKLQQDQKQLEKKIHEASTHDAKVQALVQEIQEYKETEQDLTKEYEAEKLTLLSQIGDNDGATIVQLTLEQEEEYATVRELANQASIEPRRILQQNQRQLDVARNNVTETKNEYDTTVKSVQQIKNDVSNLTERCTIMTQSVATNQTNVQETEQELTSIQNQYQQNQQKCETLDIEIEKLDIQLRDVRNYKRQNKDEERFVQAIQTLQTNYNSANSNNIVYGRLQDLCHPTQRKYATAVATAAGKDMDAIVVSNNEIGFDCIKYLREQKIGIATFLPLSSLQVPALETIEHIRSQISNDDRYRLAIDVIQCDDENIQRAILYAVGTTVVCDDLDSARELCFGKKTSSQQHRSSSRHHTQSSNTSLQLNVKAVTLGGAVISKAGTMTGGTSNKDDNDSRWKNQDIEKLRTKKEELEAERAELDHNVGDRSQQGAGSGYASQIEFLRNKLNNLKNREHYSKSELEYTKKTLKEKETLLQATEKQLSRLKKKLAATEKNCEKCNKAVKEASNAVKVAEDEHLAPFRTATGLRDLKAYESAMGQFRDEYQKKKRAVIEHITQLEQQKEFEMGRDMKQPITRIEKRIRERTLSLQQAEERAIELQAKIDKAKQQLTDAEKKLQEATENEKECEINVQKVQASYAEAQATTMKHKKLLHQEETMLEKLRSKLHETLQRARVEKVELPTRTDDEEEDVEDEDAVEDTGGRATRSSRRGSRGRSSQDNNDAGLSTQGSESQCASATGTLTQETSSRGLTQYSQDDHPIVVRDQEKASQIDFSKLSKTLQRRVSDRDEKKIRNDFEDKIQKATSEIESITPNMKANDAFMAATQRLKDSKNDTDKAKENAIKAAQAFSRVKAKRTKCFMEAYNHIEESLKTIYTDMTKSSKHPLGGNAYLSLDDVEEPYKGGLKFNAMPPMKRFRDMEQLSGGEKTVAALSLLFAIHSYHPAPFFVMDEVDAALDNINLRKVCNYICQRSRSDFQCIVISLKDMFYEHSDSLIGIYRDMNINSSNTLTLDLTKYDPPSTKDTTTTPASNSSNNKRGRLSIFSATDDSNAPKKGRTGSLYGAQWCMVLLPAVETRSSITSITNANANANATNNLAILRASNCASMKSFKCQRIQMSISTGTSNTTTAPTGKKKVGAKKSLLSLGNIFHYLEGTILMVELKTGHCYIGKLLSSTTDMNLMLVDVIVITPNEPPCSDAFHQHCHNNNYKLLQYYHQTISSSSSSSSSQQQQQQQPVGNIVDTVQDRIVSTTTLTTNNSSSTKRSRKAGDSKPILQLVHIRGSKIRYIHFIDHNNDKNTINDLVQIGIHREKIAKQQYQRGVRK